jgi:ELWxxDGT repeat protein
MRHASWSVVLVLASGLCAHAQAPYLVRDINLVSDATGGLGPMKLTPAGDLLYFLGRGGGIGGLELWGTQGTPGSTRLVVDIEPAPFTFTDDLVAVGATVFFARSNQAVGNELWRSDGTIEGTRLVADLRPGPLHSGPSRLTAAAGLLFFIADDGSGPGLFRSDGTTAGTFRVRAGDAELLLPGAGPLFFVVTTPAFVSELWTSDGTLQGTRLVSAFCSGCGAPTKLTRTGGLVYFLVWDGSDWHLWRTDGTAGNTAMVPNFDVDAPGFMEMIGAGDRLFLTSGRTIWRVDPGEAPQAVLTSVDAHALAAQGGGLYFVTQGNNFGRIFKSDGTPAGTQQVVEYCSTLCFNLHPRIVTSSRYAFYTLGQNGAGVALWRTDGTAAGTVQLSSEGFPESLTIWQDRLFFAGEDARGKELWTTDGTPAGTGPVYDLTDSPSNPFLWRPAADRLYFSAATPAEGYDLWTSAGTEASTIAMQTLPGPNTLSILEASPLGSGLVFTGPSGLWFSDGTPSGTGPIASMQARALFTDGPQVLFGGAPFADVNLELWRTDGTPAGTTFLKELVPGGFPANPRHVGTLGDQHFLAVSNTPGELWRTDGTTDGTVFVKAIFPTEGVALGSVLILSATDHTNGRQLWRTDGTPEGTVLVKLIYPGSNSASPRLLTRAGDFVFFVADSPAGAARLWRTDGTTDGTTLVAEAGQVIAPMVEMGGILYFLNYDLNLGGPYGHELWRSDGTADGTHIVEDIAPGRDSPFVVFQGTTPLVVAGGRLWFEAHSLEHGLELWRSDGTAAGTAHYADIAPGPRSSGLEQLTTGPGHLYFTADDGTHGRELWALPMVGLGAADTDVVEGDGAGVIATLSIRLSTPASAPLSVSYSTTDGTATAGADYLATSGTLTFPPGVDVLTVSVPIVGDLTDEGHETFSLTLSATAPVVVVDATATATIRDDDGPLIAIDSTSVTEGDGTSTAALFPITLTTEDGTPTPAPQAVAFATEGVTATSGVDFVAGSGAVTFPAGTASGTTMAVAVQVTGDTLDEPDESFAVRLQAAGDAVLVTGAGVGHILDDDGIDVGPPIEIAPGSALRADFTPPAGRVADRDDYVLLQQPQASYEVAVDEASGIGAPLTLVRLAPDGTTVLQSGSPVGTGSALSLRWENTGVSAITDQRLSVSSAACGSACGPDDRYRLRAYETTLSAPRFNNVNGQGTVVLLQNTTASAISGRLLFWVPGGSLGHAQPFTVPARGGVAINTLAIYPSSGTLTVTHDGPYGALVGKAVALEPSTGFSFDTPFTSRPR